MHIEEMLRSTVGWPAGGDTAVDFSKAEPSEYRIEHDSIGEKKIPAEAYYGIQSMRAAENFRITGLDTHPEMLCSIAYIKKAAALTNCSTGALDRDKADAIAQACDEILDGGFRSDFIVDPMQGGAGTSLNMNANEVIANRAIEILGGTKGDYSLIHPNDHVNLGQSTNDVIPTAGKMAAIRMLTRLRMQLQVLHLALSKKSEEFDHVIKMGRTQMQDAVPVRLGQEFRAYADTVERSIFRIEKAADELRAVNLGGTAIGTGVNADKEYMRKVVPVLCDVSGIDLVQADDLIDATQNLDPFVSVSGVVKTCAVSLSKISNDLRLMSSGPKAGFAEITLPARQSGSSIMPGKINPVIPEIVNQVAFNVIGNDTTIALAAEAGQLELNAFLPIIFYNLFQSIDTLGFAVETFADNCVSGITANEKRCRELVESSVGIVTTLAAVIGYDRATDIAKKALIQDRPVREIILGEGLLDEDEVTRLLDPARMTGIGSEDRD
jgi:aspartate ammonia-lyase